MQEETSKIYIKNIATNASVSEKVSAFKKKYRCENCVATKLYCVAEKVGLITHQLMQTDPCTTNLTNKIISTLDEHYGELAKECCPVHQKRFILFVANKCIISSVKMLRTALIKQKLKDKKKKTYTHYKLRIIKSI